MTATLSQRATPRGKRKRVTVALRPVKLTLPAVQRRTFRLTLDRTAAARLRKALGPLRGLAVNVQLTATAPAGEPTLFTRRVNATG